MSYIEMRGIVKIYNKGKDNEVAALRGADLIVEKGESVAVMGVSGSGKSTLLNIIGTLDDATEGSYFLDGEDISKLSALKKARLRNEKIGFALQDFGLLEGETAMYNIKMPLYFGKSTAKELKTKPRETAEKLGIDQLLKRKVSSLSGGQKQRVAIARALVNDPQLILADEPTSALDRKTADEIVGIFVRLQKELGKTVVMVTHDKAVAERFDRIVRIEDGRIYG